MLSGQILDTMITSCENAKSVLRRAAIDPSDRKTLSITMGASVAAEFLGRTPEALAKAEARGVDLSQLTLAEMQAEEAGIGHAAMVPDVLTLPRPAEGWAVSQSGGRAAVRDADGTGFEVPAPLLRPGLSSGTAVLASSYQIDRIWQACQS